MISELAFIRGNGTFWKSLFPGGDDYVRLINSALGEKFTSPIVIDDVPNRRALINGISFSIFELATKKDIQVSTIESFSKDTPTIKQILIQEKESLAGFKFGDELSNELSDKEIEIIKNISLRLIAQYSNKSNLIVRPRFKGCGILFEAFGDVFYYNTLSEIKAGDRNFSIQDLRQLYVYLSLNHQSKQLNIAQMELCNPRTGVIWREYIDIVSDNIAGSSTIEIYNEIINFISNDNRSL